MTTLTAYPLSDTASVIFHADGRVALDDGEKSLVLSAREWQRLIVVWSTTRA